MTMRRMTMHWMTWRATSGGPYGTAAALAIVRAHPTMAGLMARYSDPALTAAHKRNLAGGRTSVPVYIASCILHLPYSIVHLPLRKSRCIIKPPPVVLDDVAGNIVSWQEA